ncbi:MAG: cytochrome c biogenesis protein CcdA [Candidatus Lutacidiplasmatales archaeon]
MEGKEGVRKRLRLKRIAPILGVVVAVAVALVLLTHVLPTSSGKPSSPALAPNFTLTDIYGKDFTLSSYRNHSVVVIEFTSLSCSACQIVEKSLKALYANYNTSGPGKVQFVSVYIEPQFGDTVPALKSYQASNAIPWTMARDTSSLAVMTEYGAQDIPTIVIIDKPGHVIYDQSGLQSEGQLQTNVDSALAGTASAISIVTVSVFVLAAVAGVSTFFSPCAFPMFPGYMSLFLGLNTNTADSRTASGGTYGGAVRRAAVAGSVTALGMIVVFLIIGVALVLAASLVSRYIPYFLVIVGAALIGMGALLFTNLQYWKIVTPLQRLWQRLRGQDPQAVVPVTAPPADGKGLHLKLFSYGMGYAAAAAGCVAPVIFSAIVAGLAVGLVGGIVNILIYSLTAAVLMIAVTVMLAMAGKKYVNQLKAYTPVIKKVSAGVLVLVGIYLIYFFYAAWGL